MGLPTYGTMAVDWEERIRFDRLREEGLGRTKRLRPRSGTAALLCYDLTTTRNTTTTHIERGPKNKLNRFCLLPQGHDPIIYNFDSAPRHHQLYNPWLSDGRSRAGISTLRG